MFKIVSVICLATTVVVATGCASGPSYLSRSVDDWQNKNYEKNPLVTGFFTDVLPFYPLVEGLAEIPDKLVLNPIQFWGHDVWTGEGRAFTHKNPEQEQPPWFIED